MSEKSLYARVALSEHGSKVLTVVFDEWRGTGKGYDLIHADVGLSGKLDGAMRLEASISKCPAGVKLTFPPIELNVPYNKEAVGISNPCQVILSYEKHLSGAKTALSPLRSSSVVTNVVMREEFFASTSVRLRVGSEERQYSFKRSMEPAQSLNDTPVWAFPRSPKVAIIAKRDPRQGENIGIGVDLEQEEGQEHVTAGIQFEGGGCGCPPIEMPFQCKPPINAHVEMKSLDDKVVHRGDATLDKFAFG